MPHYHAPLAFLPHGWARDVLFDVDETGTLVAVGGAAHTAVEGRPASSTAGGASPTHRPAPGPAESTGSARPPDPHTNPPTPLPGVVVPGVPNLHSHAFQRALAGRTERGSPSGETFWSWRERMYAFLRVLGPDDVEAIAAQLYAEMLRHGYTAVAEFHYLHLDPGGRPYDAPDEMGRRVLAAAATAGLGVTLLPVLYLTGDFGGAPPGEGQRRFVLDEERHHDLLERALTLTGPDANAAAGLALHSLRAVPPDALGRALERWEAGAPGAPIHLHVAEQRREVEASVAWSGRRPVAWLLEHAPVDARWCLVHATHLDDAEVDALARSGAVAGLCPTTEANLGDGIFRLGDFVRAGGAFGVGSDSHVSTSPVEELRWLEYGQRLLHERRNVAAGPADRSSARTLLEAAWDGGARACGRPVGALEPGRRADWVVLDPDHPALAGLEGDALLDGWIFSGNDSPVREVWVGGQRLVEAGRHVRGEAIAGRYRETVRRLAERL